MTDVFNGLGIPILLNAENDFLKIKETLTRMGVASNKNKILYQSCHILHKRGQYAILHFKEMFLMDGKESDITEDDLKRRNKIAKLLIDWGLAKLAKPKELLVFDNISLKVLNFKESSEWELKPKYHIGIKL